MAEKEGERMFIIKKFFIISLTILAFFSMFWLVAGHVNLFFSDYNKAILTEKEKELKLKITNIKVLDMDKNLSDDGLLLIIYRNGVISGTSRFENHNKKADIVNYYQKELVKNGWRFERHEEQIDFSNNKKISDRYYFVEQDFGLSLSFNVKDNWDFSRTIYYIRVYALKKD